MNPARFAAYQSLIAIEKNRRYSNIELDTKLKTASLSDPDRRLYTALVYGTLERMITLDYLITRFSNRKIDKIDRELNCVLRLSLYQIYFMDKIPQHAILNEAAELAKIRHQKRGADFVTGVLRAALRGGMSIAELTESLEDIKKQSIRTSIRDWMLRLWIDAYGSERAQAIALAFQAPSTPTIFVNLQKCSVDKLVRLFAENEIGVRKVHETLPLLQFSAPPGDVQDLPGYREGLFFVQDRSCAEAVSALRPQARERIADLCAAPGGKSFAAAVLSQDQAEIFASDLHENKLSLIRATSDRLGFSSIRVFCRDARKITPEESMTFDKVICDVPCSGMGILSKKPDLRHKDPADLVRLPQIQFEILSGGASLVKRGGALLYSTCTLNPRENEDVISRFLTENHEFMMENEPVTLFPEAGASDGFFYGVIKRK